MPDGDKTLAIVIVGGIAAAGLLAWYIWSRQIQKCTEGETQCINRSIHICRNGQWVSTGEQCEAQPVSAEIIDVGIVY